MESQEILRRFEKHVEENEISQRDIIKMAFHTDANIRKVVLYNYELDELESVTWIGNTRLNPDYPAIKVYELQNNWFNNAPFDVNDILYDEEWNWLQEKYGNEASYLDEAQVNEVLQEFGTETFDDRLIDYLDFVGDIFSDFYGWMSRRIELEEI